jgi:glycosyltransferase involved in cell wall biosynthesis
MAVSAAMKLAFVIPWYGESIPGGAEAECRATAKAFHKKGHSVEIFTTCVREFLSDWSVNHHPAGESVEGGLKVLRFPVRRRDTQAFDAVNLKLMRSLPVSAEEQETFMRENVSSPALYDHIARCPDDYLFLFTPYMFGTTYWGSQVCPRRSLLIPCLHDESYAYMPIVKRMVDRFSGLLFYSDFERRLASSLYGTPAEKMAVMGGGVDSAWTADAERFRRKYGLQDFIVYAGRRDAGKNVAMLVDYFSRYRRETGDELELVLLGKGSLEIPAVSRRWIRDLGFVSLQDKYDCFAAATFFCLPSLYESFSIVIMEAWLAETPVVVYERCQVAKEHCLSSNGGLYFANYEEFAEITGELRRRSDLRCELARRGKQYVQENYTWAAVHQRFTAALRQWGWPVEERCAV